MKGRTALVTAASKGIGFGIANGLAQEGCDVIITSSNEKNLENARAKIVDRHGSHIMAYLMDLRFPDSVALKLQEIMAVNPTIDILIVNGPGPSPGAAADLDYTALQPVLDTTLASAVQLCHGVLPKMIEAGFGRIVVLASSTAKEPDEGMVLSNVSRAGVIAYAKSLSREVAQHGITVNSILTGGVLTERTDELMKLEAEQAGVPLDRFLEHSAQTIPAGYICSPTEFARPIVFLCSRAAAYVNGVNLPIDGGYMRGL